MKSDLELLIEVQNSIKWEPLLNTAEIGVTCMEGLVTLTGVVDKYAKKMEAGKAAMNVPGVKAVADEILVKFGSRGKRDDPEIAISAAKALKWNRQVLNDKTKVNVLVQDGWVTLNGRVKWNYEREAAHNVLHSLPGIRGVTNCITIRTGVDKMVEKGSVEAAIARHASICDEDITVDVLDNTVILTGTVGSIYQKNKAAEVAWNTPGVRDVNNNLRVQYYYAAVAQSEPSGALPNTWPLKIDHRS
jgi:osmotically-inducible protein OsmY